MNRALLNYPPSFTFNLSSPTMHVYVQEAIFVTTIISGLVWAYKTISAGLQEVRDAARSPDPEEPKQTPAKQLDPDAENKIELETLRVLSEGHSFSLRNAAIKIASQRAVNDDNRKLLLRCLASKNKHHRDNAIRALWFLFNGPEGREHQYKYSLHARFQDHEALEAIITGLVSLLPYHQKVYHDDSRVAPNLPPSPIAPLRRPRQEKTLLKLLLTALRGTSRTHMTTKDSQHVDVALEAGLVTRWLAHYPFPCSLPQFSKYNYKKSDVCSLFGTSRYAHDDQDMHEIIRTISSSPKGSNHLRAVGLKASRITEDIEHQSYCKHRGSLNSTDSHICNSLPRSRSRANSIAESLAESGDVSMVGGEGTAGEPVSNWTPVSFAEGWEELPQLRQRLREQSQEEVSLRRRNREAVVVAERGEPLGRENILRSEDSGRMFDDGGIANEARRRQHARLEDGTENGDEDEDDDSMPELEAVGSGEVVAFANAMPALPEMRTLFEQAARRRNGDQGSANEDDMEGRTSGDAALNEAASQHDLE